MALQTDTPAPDIVLKTKSESGLAEVRLSDHFGRKKTVLLFFPLAFSSGCTKELCTVRDSLKQYEDLGASVLGISVDSPYALQVFAKQEGINFPLLSDFNRAAIEAYDVVCPDLAGLKGVAKRSAFVIDEQGKIIFSSSSDDPRVMPDFSAIQAALRS